MAATPKELELGNRSAYRRSVKAGERNTSSQTRQARFPNDPLLASQSLAFRTGGSELKTRFLFRVLSASSTKAYAGLVYAGGN